MLDPNSALFMLLMSVKAWAATVFYCVAIYYIITKLRRKK